MFSLPWVLHHFRIIVRMHRIKSYPAEPWDNSVQTTTGEPWGTITKHSIQRDDLDPFRAPITPEFLSLPGNVEAYLKSLQTGPSVQGTGQCILWARAHCLPCSSVCCKLSKDNQSISIKIVAHNKRFGQFVHQIKLKPTADMLLRKTGSANTVPLEHA